MVFGDVNLENKSFEDWWVSAELCDDLNINLNSMDYKEGVAKLLEVSNKFDNPSKRVINTKK